MTMRFDDKIAGAQILADNRRARRGLVGLPGELEPADEADGYDLQATLHLELEARGRGRRTGWKIGCTTPVMQDYMRIDHPCAGGVFDSAVFRSGDEVALSMFRRLGLECEIAVRLGRDVAPGDLPATRDGAAEAVAAVMASLELVDDRYRDFRSLATPLLIADDFFAAGCVLGPEVEDWRGLDLAAVRGAMTVDGETVGEGPGAAILGHPLDALAWLLDHMAGRGVTLKAGDFVTLGSVVQTAWPEAPRQVTASFDGLGEARAIFV